MIQIKSNLVFKGGLGGGKSLLNFGDASLITSNKIDLRLCVSYRVLGSTLSVFSPDYIHSSLAPSSTSRRPRSSCFSFSRFVDVSPAELHSQLVMARWVALYLIMKVSYRVHFGYEWAAGKKPSR